MKMSVFTETKTKYVIRNFLFKINKTKFLSLRLKMEMMTTPFHCAAFPNVPWVTGAPLLGVFLAHKTSVVCIFLLGFSPTPAPLTSVSLNLSGSLRRPQREAFTPFNMDIQWAGSLQAFSTHPGAQPPFCQ